MEFFQQDIREKFQSQLSGDERILWAGQPDPSVNFTLIDLYLVPFSLLWGGFAIFWELSALSVTGSGEGGPNLVFSVFGIPFVLIGLYLIFGRFLFKKWRKRRTYYAITDRRIISLTETFGRNIQELGLKSIEKTDKKVGRNGNGSLTFNKGAFSFLSGSQFYANTGLDFFTVSQIGFYDIADVEEACRILTEAKNSAIKYS